MDSDASGPGFGEIARALRELPPPDGAAAKASARLLEVIRQAISEAGEPGISFAHFMELALYYPGLGYYSAGSRKFGLAGDFVTAPELSPLFSYCLAHQCAELLAEGGAILEVGAGSGTMAADILAELARLGTLPSEYCILEVSADLRTRQAQTLGRRVPALAERVRWLDMWPAEGFEGVVLANEVLDAMPVHRFRVDRGRPCEIAVVWEDGRLAERCRPPADPVLASRLGALVSTHQLPDGYTSEVCPAAEHWVGELGRRLRRGVALLIDYGFPAREYYHPQRADGTLMCHYRHRAHQDPYFAVGLQDITAHVDFTAVAEAALAAGLSPYGFTNQANFLLGNGLGERVVVADPKEQLMRAAAAKRLLMPGEMGELFKVLAVGRDVHRPLAGFSLRDDRSRL